MKNYLFALLALGFVLYSCSKDDDDKKEEEGGMSERMTFITSASWKYDTVGLDNNKDGKIDAAIPPFAPIKTCELDNNITLKNDSTGVLNEGATKCDAAVPQTTNFKWWFKENESILYTPDALFGANFSGDFKIGEVTSTKLRLIKEISYAPFGTFTVVMELKH